MSDPELKVDVVLPAATLRSVGEVYLVSGAVGLWTFLVAGYLLWSTVADSMWLVKIIAMLLWPVVWFIGMVAYSQLFMGMAQLYARCFQFAEEHVKNVASVLMLTGFTMISGVFIMDLRVIPGFLGGVWFAGAAVALVREVRGFAR